MIDFSFIFFGLLKNYFFGFLICLLRLFLFLFLYTLLFLFLSISTFTSLFFKLFKFLNTPLKLFLFLPCFLTYFFNLYHHNQLVFLQTKPRTGLLAPSYSLGNSSGSLGSLIPLTNGLEPIFSGLGLRAQLFSPR